MYRTLPCLHTTKYNRTHHYEVVCTIGMLRRNITHRAHPRAPSRRSASGRSATLVTNLKFETASTHRQKKSIFNGIFNHHVNYSSPPPSFRAPLAFGPPPPSWLPPSSLRVQPRRRSRRARGDYPPPPPRRRAASTPRRRHVGASWRLWRRWFR